MGLMVSSLAALMYTGNIVLLASDLQLAPVILGYVLGGLMEQNLRRALSISDGDVSILWQSGISLGLWIAAAALLVLPWLLPKLLSSRRQEAS